MIFGLFRRSDNDAIIDRLYATVVEASRRPALYLEMGIPDTFEGRFESLTLHASLVVRRLKDAPAPGPEISQSLVDAIFRHFDRTLREMGVGDTSVPKRMKTLAEAFLGRGAAYDQALQAGDPQLQTCLQRNICPSAHESGVLARYVRAGVQALSAEPLQSFIDAAIVFPDPTAFADPAIRTVEVTY